MRHISSFYFPARRRAAAKRKKLKNLGKSKSTDTEEEDGEDDADDGESYFTLFLIGTVAFYINIFPFYSVKCPVGTVSTNCFFLFSFTL